MSNLLCYDCANACGGCSWSRSFTPVEGWTATPSKIKNGDSVYIDTYHVTACPYFESDVHKYSKRPRSLSKGRETELNKQILELRRSGKGYENIAKELHISYSTVYEALKKAGFAKEIRRNTHVTTGVRADILSLRESGYLIKEIAEAVGYSTTTVRNVLKEEKADAERVSTKTK